MTPLSAFAQATADIALTKQASTESVVPGAQFNYTLTVTNDGPDTAEDVRFTDPLPAELTFVSCSTGSNDPAEFCSIKGGTVRVRAGTLNTRTSRQVTVVVELKASTPAGTQVTNTAVMSSNSYYVDNNPANDSASETITAASAAEPLTFYLHGLDIPGTAGGFTMDMNPPSPPQTLALNLINGPKWYSDPALNGSFAAGNFVLSFPCTLGIGLATTYALHRTALDGSNPELIASLTQPLQICTGLQTISIPSAGAEAFDDERLRLRIATLLGLSVTLNLGEDVKLVTPEFDQDTGPDPF